MNQLLHLSWPIFVLKAMTKAQALQKSKAKNKDKDLEPRQKPKNSRPKPRLSKAAKTATITSITDSGNFKN